MVRFHPHPPNKGSIMSQFTKELREFAIRLKKDGYPTTLVERAVERMEAMEAEIIRLNDDKIAERSNN